MACLPSSVALRKIDPNGRSPSQFEVTMNKKIVVTIGKYFSESLRSPRTESMSFKICSRRISKKLWNLPGINFSFLLRVKPIIRRIIKLTKESRRELVMGQFPIRKSSSAFKDISGIGVFTRPILLDFVPFEKGKDLS